MMDIYKELMKLTGLSKSEIDEALDSNISERISEGNIIKKPKRIKDWRVLEFEMPISSTITEGSKMKIKGTAINEVTTRNKVKYIAKELEKAAPTFRNVPILLDHKNEVQAIVGRSTNNVNWNPQTRALEFEANIMDEKIQQMINDGRITSVSIGAQVDDLVEQEDGSMLATGIRGLELSLVAVPGDPNANIAMAMQESFDMKKRELVKKKENKKYSEKKEIDEIAESLPKGKIKLLIGVK